jgi:hypothetical protein
MLRMMHAKLMMLTKHMAHMMPKAHDTQDAHNALDVGRQSGIQMHIDAYRSGHAPDEVQTRDGEI